MRRESGNRDSSIWLIGDSSPPRWAEHLEDPLDSRHPARHNIWTPVLDGIQRHVFTGDRRRVDDSRLYVRNAVHNPDDKPPYGDTEWRSKLRGEIGELGDLLCEHGPPLVFTFGAFAFEFTRRSLSMGPKRSQRYWSTEKLGVKFRHSVENFKTGEVNVFPLLHVSIARRHFLKSHENFTGQESGNYFCFVSGEIGSLLLDHRKTLDVWVGLEKSAR